MHQAMKADNPQKSSRGFFELVELLEGEMKLEGMEGNLARLHQRFKAWKIPGTGGLQMLLGSQLYGEH